MKNLQNSVLTVAMAIGLAITGLSPAQASPSATSTTITQEPDTSISESISAASTAKISFDKTPITTSAASSVDVPVETVQPQSSESVSTVTTTPAAQAAPTVALSAPAKTVSAPTPAAHVADNGSRNAVVAAALAQLGVAQDCTALVSNSLRAIGINFHGWPADYMSLGHVVPESAAQPGDLIYYANGGTGMAHIAVYIGNGQAVHGGWNGGTTALASAHIGSGPVFIRIG